jgi:hypothetical protein
MFVIDNRNSEDIIDATDSNNTIFLLIPVKANYLKEYTIIADQILAATRDEKAGKIMGSSIIYKYTEKQKLHYYFLIVGKRFLSTH